MILRNAESAVADYNRRGIHYNLAAEGIYRARAGVDPFSDEYEPFIIAGLIAFDMGRMMGQGDKYSLEGRGFRNRLRAKVRTIRGMIGDLPACCLHQVDLVAFADVIEAAYDHLAAAGEGGLNSDQADQFHVGATKVLHWIAPSLFIMLDANVATAFREHHRVSYRRSTQPGYTAKKYLECLRHTQNEIHAYGNERFMRIELKTPIARLFDKAAWITGA